MAGFRFKIHYFNGLVYRKKLLHATSPWACSIYIQLAQANTLLFGRFRFSVLLISKYKESAPIVNIMRSLLNCNYSVSERLVHTATIHKGFCEQKSFDINPRRPIRPIIKLVIVKMFVLDTP